jgi:hypothetical protein
MEGESNLMLERIAEWVAHGVGSSSFYVSGLWGIDCFFQPSPLERKFAYNIVVAQTHGQGACYYHGTRIDPAELAKYAGTELGFQLTGNRYVDIALLDSLAAALEATPSYEVILRGDGLKKARERAVLVVGEVLHAARNSPKQEPTRVCNVGVVNLIVQGLLDAGLRVTASDLDPGIIGSVLFDCVTVMPGDRTLELVAEADVAVVSGMTLATQSLDAILNTAKSHNTRVVLFAQTGAGFAPFYVEQGIDCVVAEPFPFYIYEGMNLLRVFRRGRE